LRTTTKRENKRERLSSSNKHGPRMLVLPSSCSPFFSFVSSSSSSSFVFFHVQRSFV
jgi:hypothetical protein